MIECTCPKLERPTDPLARALEIVEAAAKEKMTLRDQFAAAVLSAMPEIAIRRMASNSVELDVHAEFCYEVADAFLKARTATKCGGA